MSSRVFRVKALCSFDSLMCHTVVATLCCLKAKSFVLRGTSKHSWGDIMLREQNNLHRQWCSARFEVAVSELIAQRQMVRPELCGNAAITLLLVVVFSDIWFWALWEKKVRFFLGCVGWGEVRFCYISQWILTELDLFLTSAFLLHTMQQWQHRKFACLKKKKDRREAAKDFQK